MERPNYTILAVNDFLPEQLQALTGILKKAGCNVLEATNPNAAIRLATKQHPDLIISDLSQPLIEGFDLHRRVRSIPEIADIPILIISALRLPTTPSINNTHPTRDDFLEAPYEPIALMTKIAKLVERKRTQDELLHSQQRYIELFENAADIVYPHDLQGHYTSLNKKGQQITGYSLDEIEKIDFNTLASPDDVELAREMLRRKLEDNETCTVYEISILAKDGSIIPVEVSTQLIFENNKPVGVQGIARDITTRKQAEQKLLEADRRAITEYKILLRRIAKLGEVLSSAREQKQIFTALLEFTTVSLPCNSLGIALYNHEQVELTPHFLWLEKEIIDVPSNQSP